MQIIFKHQNLKITNSHYAIIQGVKIHSLNRELEQEKSKSLQEVLNYSDDEVINNEVSIGYTEILKEFNKENLIPAGQNFVEVIRKRGKFPTINTAVDAYNITVARTYLSIGAHDLDQIKGDLVFDFAKQGESIPAVNMQNAFNVDEGDYVYRDHEKILAWLDVRDTDLAKLTKETKNIILIIEGNRRTTNEYIHNHLKTACECVIKYSGGSYEINRILTD